MKKAKHDFEVVKNQLGKSGIPFVIDPSLVRGLDYYTKLTFEIDSGSVGAQTALWAVEDMIYLLKLLEENQLRQQDLQLALKEFFLHVRTKKVFLSLNP